MAHKGKFYKLWFRRDAAWNTNNYRQAFPEAYTVKFNQPMASTRYATALLRGELGINLNKTYDRVWTSPTVGGFFDGCYWRATCEADPNGDYNPWRFEIRHPAIIETPIFNALYDVQQHPTSPFNIKMGGLIELRFLSPDLQCNPANLLIELLAAGYERYDP